VVGSNAKTNDVIARCYATGSVLAETGSGSGDFGGQPGASMAPNAGGIVGYNYFDPTARIENCAALNSNITGIGDAESTFNAHRVAGSNADGAYCSNNIANSAMTLTAGGSVISAADKTANGLDGADCDAKPAQSVYEGLSWDFAAVWTMGGNGYPALRWQ
jgi:hypothetical protein